MKVRVLVSWVCPTRFGENGKVLARGCGGNWGPRMPGRCPTCGGRLFITQRLREVAL